MEQIFVLPQLELAHQAQHFLEIYALGSVPIPINLYGSNSCVAKDRKRADG